MCACAGSQAIHDIAKQTPGHSNSSGSDDDSAPPQPGPGPAPPQPLAGPPGLPQPGPPATIAHVLRAINEVKVLVRSCDEQLQEIRHRIAVVEETVQSYNGTYIGAQVD